MKVEQTEEGLFKLLHEKFDKIDNGKIGIDKLNAYIKMVLQLRKMMNENNKINKMYERIKTA